MKKKRIKNLEQLRKYASREQGAEVALILNGGLLSRKLVKFFIDDKRQWYILNFIDDSQQNLDEPALFDDQQTLIGKAMKMNALILEN